MLDRLPLSGFILVDCSLLLEQNVKGLVHRVAECVSSSIYQTRADRKNTESHTHNTQQGYWTDAILQVCVRERAANLDPNIRSQFGTGLDPDHLNCLNYTKVYL